MMTACRSCRGPAPRCIVPLMPLTMQDSKWGRMSGGTRYTDLHNAASACYVATVYLTLLQ